LVARLALPGRELPVGVVTAALGAPVLVWLVFRNRQP
jgi:iron complex transport system permease protein